MVVTGGEDRYLNVWQCSDQQIILQPAQSIWAVTILPNTDIVVGSRYVLMNVFSFTWKHYIIKNYFSIYRHILRT